MGANHRLLNANMTCGDCAHLRMTDPGDDEGSCSEAAEALALEGWPKVTVAIEPEMSAESCPCFEASRAVYGPDEAADDAYHAKRDDELCEALASKGGAA
jgi:hypothetical protein